MTGTALAHPPHELNRERFIAIYGGIYEDSPWVAQAVFDDPALRDLVTVEQLHAAMRRVVDQAPMARRRALIAAHPDLACAPEKMTRLTRASQNEQAGAGLAHCTAAEYEEFGDLNRRYRQKFGFPFIIAVKGLHRTEILDRFRQRITRDRAAEFDRALREIHQIARGRLTDLTTDKRRESDTEHDTENI